LDAETRHRLRLAVSAARIAAIDWQREPRCTGCGVELLDPISERPRFALGCDWCRERERSRRRRAEEAAAAVGPSEGAQLVFTVVA
jgi:hypothetical protein